MFEKQGRRSAQALYGIKGFTRYGLLTAGGELLLFRIAPTNISVLSHVNVDIKIRHLQTLLSAYPEVEFICTDASETFDGNKAFLQERLAAEANAKVRELLEKDIAMLDELQTEMASARQFLLVYRCRALKPEQVFSRMNDLQKKLSGEGFESKRLGRREIKHFLALYFGASLYGEDIPDADGAQYLPDIRELQRLREVKA